MIFNDVLNDLDFEILFAEKGARLEKMKNMYKRFEGKTKIFERVFDDDDKINNMLSVDYRGDIVETITGYFLGHPISRQLDESRYNKVLAENIKKVLSDFLVKNNMEDIDAEVGKYQSVCGSGVKLLYVPTNDSDIRVKVIKPWECIFDDEDQYAIRKYTKKERIKGKIEYVTYIEVYDEKYIYFIKRNPSGEYINYETKPHLFSDIPLIEYPNNEERIGDFEKVETLIDAYERTLSDTQNELEELRLAYMLFHNMKITKSELKKAKKTGGFILGDDQDVTFLTKQIDINSIIEHKKDLNRLIHTKSKCPDMSDESFSGNQSGESRKWKLQGLENKCIIKERKFNTGDRHMFKCLELPWSLKGLAFSYLDIYNQFTRNIPVELSYEAEVANKLGINISQKTGLSLLSFIDDPDYEIELKNNENVQITNPEMEK